jgi:predicted ArsR family transcriptional regulator
MILKVKTLFVTSCTWPTCSASASSSSSQAGSSACPRGATTSWARSWSPRSTRTPSNHRREVARRTARDRGHAIGEEVKPELRLRPPGSERALAVAEEALARYGYEPYRADDDTISLRNCPFHNLSRRAPEFVCGLNREFIDGFLRGLGNDSVEAALVPTPGECRMKLKAKSQ